MYVKKWCLKVVNKRKSKMMMIKKKIMKTLKKMRIKMIKGVDKYL